MGSIPSLIWSWFFESERGKKWDAVERVLTKEIEKKSRSEERLL
jgi:hypothetical protein